VSLQQIFGCAPTPCFYWDRSPDYAFGTRKVSNSGAHVEAHSSLHPGAEPPPCRGCPDSPHRIRPGRFTDLRRTGCTHGLFLRVGRREPSRRSRGSQAREIRRRRPATHQTPACGGALNSRASGSRTRPDAARSRRCKKHAGDFRSRPLLPGQRLANVLPRMLAGQPVNNAFRSIAHLLDHRRALPDR
jgi:hypothetical protein